MILKIEHRNEGHKKTQDPIGEDPGPRILCEPRALCRKPRNKTKISNFLIAQIIEYNSQSKNCFFNVSQAIFLCSFVFQISFNSKWFYLCFMVHGLMVQALRDKIQWTYLKRLSRTCCESIDNKEYHSVSGIVYFTSVTKFHYLNLEMLNISSHKILFTASIQRFMLSQQNDVIPFQQSPMVQIGSISFLEPHKIFKRLAPSHRSNLWNILDTNKSVLWNILDRLTLP